MRIRVAIADDHAILREGLAKLLRDCDGIEVVQLSASGEELLRSADYDIAVCDVSMPTGAMVVAARMKKLGHRARVIALTAHEETGVARSAMQAGVHGYVLKKNAFEELLAAIHAVHAGRSYVSPCLAGSLLTADPEVDHPRLSSREQEVLIGIARGWPYKRIARENEISVRTVETYRARLLTKLNLATTADLIRHATENGYLETAGDSPP